jgi:hypothetical protein
LQIGVEALVDAPVRGLLADEELLAGREAHRQRIEECGLQSAFAPAWRQRRFQVDKQASDGQGARRPMVWQRRRARCGSVAR